MPIIKPFFCIRPRIAYASTIAALPYDVYSREEAHDIVEKNPLSFLSIDRAETNFENDVEPYPSLIYEKASSLFEQHLKKQIYIEETEPCLYLYELAMNGHTQTGIVACSSVDDYINGNIKKHEATLPDKVFDRTCHIETCNSHTGPVFLVHQKNDVLKSIITSQKENLPLYDFTSNDRVHHKVYRISEPEIIQHIQRIFSDIPCSFIADGHHRAAAAVVVAKKHREENPHHTGREEYNFFLSVSFPEDEVQILDYNRVVSDLNGMTSEEFLEKMKMKFHIVPISTATPPTQKGTFSMLLNQQWYLCRIPEKLIPDNPVESLDVSVLQNEVLGPILGIHDPKTDRRIDFVGGIRGLGELEHRCATDAKVAFAMYPTSIQELINVADHDLLMPPKSTWFEPKLRSGLFIHAI